MKSTLLFCLVFFSLPATSQIDSLSIHFAFNSDFVSASEHRVLTKIQAIDKQTVVLKAYTDTVGDTESNRKLAEIRLESVERMLPKELVILEREIIGEDLSQRSDADKRRVDILIQAAQVHEEIAIEEAPLQVEIGVPIQLGVEFYNASDVVIPEFIPEIQRLYEIMKADEKLKVHLIGHVCCVNDYARSLSRAVAIQTYLMNYGISPERITTEGVGNTQPMYEEINEWTQQRNRRVEAVFSRD